MAENKIIFFLSSDSLSLIEAQKVSIKKKVSGMSVIPSRENLFHTRVAPVSITASKENLNEATRLEIRKINIKAATEHKAEKSLTENWFSPKIDIAPDMNQIVNGGYVDEYKPPGE